MATPPEIPEGLILYTIVPRSKMSVFPPRLCMDYYGKQGVKYAGRSGMLSDRFGFHSAQYDLVVLQALTLSIAMQVNTPAMDKFERDVSFWVEQS